MGSDSAGEISRHCNPAAMFGHGIPAIGMTLRGHLPACMNNRCAGTHRRRGRPGVVPCQLDIRLDTGAIRYAGCAAPARRVHGCCTCPEFHLVPAPRPCTNGVALLERVEGHALRFVISSEPERFRSARTPSTPTRWPTPVVVGRMAGTDSRDGRKRGGKRGDPLPAASVRRWMHPGEGTSDRGPLNVRNPDRGTGCRLLAAA